MAISRKLSPEDVRLIRLLVDERKRLQAEARKISDTAIAEKFGISRNTIWRIAKYDIWRDVK